MDDLDMKDLTKEYDYERLLEEEKEHYSQIEITESLTEGGIHAHGSWEYYWRRVARIINNSEYHDVVGFIKQQRLDPAAPIRVLSLGSGYCGHEIAMADRLGENYEITCTDINESLFEKAREIARQKQLKMTFEMADLNFIEIAPDTYDMILAHASIHHVINLEWLMQQVSCGLTSRGVFHLVEVVGRNRRIMWDESEEFANKLLEALPASITRGVRLYVPEEVDGMEGIRQEDILPLLREHFDQLFEYQHGAFIRFICTHELLGKYLNPQEPTSKRYLDLLIDIDESLVRNRILRPLEIWGVYRPKKS